jgi:dipeptidyl aminopeptidase/acylaminoacyl peptidase
MKYLSILCLLLWSAAAPAQVKRPFAIEDLYRLTNVDDPQFSPDGKRIAFTVSTTDLHAGKGNSDLYLIDAGGTDLRRLTSDPAADAHPRWSRDGKTIYFTSSRKEGMQLWALPLEGGEPRQVTSTVLGVGDPVVTPDGARVLFSADLFPECGADEACNKKNNDGLRSGPLQAYMADRLLYRHWTEWKEGRRTHILIRDLASGATTDLTPGDFDAPAFSLGGTGFVLSPDGTEICYVSNHDPVEAISTNKDLWVLPLSPAGGEAACITPLNKASDSEPAYSPDGRMIAYLMQAVPGYESDRFRIALYDRGTKQRRVLTEGFDNWVTALQWAPDGKSIFFTADVKGHVPLYRVDVTTGAITPVIDLKTIDGFAIAPDGKTLAITRRSVGEPKELWTCTASGAKAKRITFFNREVEETVDIRPAEEMWIASPTGERIQTYIVKPHGFDPAKKYPLILNIHGGPQSQWADAFRGDWQVYPGAGYVVAFPNPHGSTGNGQAFTEAISRDWAGKVYEDVMAVTDSLSRIPWINGDRMGAMGWSYGGYMMMWLEGHTSRFKAIASMMGVYNLKAMHGTTEELWFPEWDLGGTPWESSLYEKWSPNRFVKNYKTPCLVITGERDYRVSYTQSLEFFTDLQRMGVPSRLIVFKNDGHWPSGVKSMPFYYNAHLDWFAKYLGGAAPPYDMTKMLRNQAYEK